MLELKDTSKTKTSAAIPQSQIILKASNQKKLPGIVSNCPVKAVEATMIEYSVTLVWLPNGSPFTSTAKATDGFTFSATSICCNVKSGSSA